MSREIEEAIEKERQRCVDIINAARQGLLDTDLRSIRSCIEGGENIADLVRDE